MKTRILLAWIVGVLFLGGCLEDGTNLHYIDLQTVDTIMITNVNGGDKQRVSASAAASFRANPGEELRLVAQAVYEGEEKVSFRWVAANKKEVSVGDTLKHIFTSEDAGVLMLFAYRGDQPGANVYQVSITLNNVFAGGLVVLAKDKGKTVLDYFQSYTEKKSVEFLNGLKYNVTFYRYMPHENVFSLYNDGEELKSSNPLELFYGIGFFDWESNPSPLAALQILDRDWKNSLAINVKGMKKMTYMEDEFLDLPPADFYPESFRNIGTLSLLQGESGEVYTRVNYDWGHPCTGRFSTLPLMYNEPYDVPDKGSEKVMATQIFSKNNWAVIYEKAKERFLLMTGSGGVSTGASMDYFRVFDFSKPSAELPEGAVRMDRFDKEIYAVIPSQSYQDDLFVIYKDGGEYYVQTCAMSITTWSRDHTFSYSVKEKPLKLSAETAALLNQEGSFIKVYSDPGGNNLMFLGVGKSIYKLDILRGSAVRIIEFEEANAGNVIGIQKLKAWFEAPAYTEVNRFFVGRMLAVAFDNGDLRLLRIYDDPRRPDEILYECLFEKNYSGGIVDLLDYNYMY